MTIETKKYLIIAFLWTWIAWIGAFILSSSLHLTLNTNLTFFNLFSLVGEKSFYPQLLFALGVYGPLIGYLFTQKQRVALKFPQVKHLIYLLIPFAVAAPAFIASYLGGYIMTTAYLFFSTVPIYFLSNFITSGTEEFGWRGFLYPAYKKQYTKKSFWDISAETGIIWAVWHFPLLFIMYLPLGPAMLLPSLIGFTASIVGMNYVTNVVYEKTKNIPLVMLLHALNNTVTFTLTLVAPATPFTLLFHISIWAMAWFLEKKSKI
jgi:membrane protease YdiL (CAAX protease family)